MGNARCQLPNGLHFLPLPKLGLQLHLVRRIAEEDAVAGDRVRAAAKGRGNTPRRVVGAVTQPYRNAPRPRFPVGQVLPQFAIE